jgi:hypothetical protein
MTIQIGLGTRAEVELVSESGECERLAFDVVEDKDADFSAGFLGIGTPLAQALLRQSAGSVVPYTGGDILEVRVLAVAESTRTSEAATAQRRAALEKAISKSDMADALRFALTVDQKWGDTDPEGIEENWE